MNPLMICCQLNNWHYHTTAGISQRFKIYINYFHISSTKVNIIESPTLNFEIPETWSWSFTKIIYYCIMFKWLAKPSDIFSPLLECELKVIQSSAVITRSNIVRYFINNYRNRGRILIRCWIHKIHPIPRPNGRAMGCLLWIFVRKLTAL